MNEPLRTYHIVARYMNGQLGWVVTEEVVPDAVLKTAWTRATEIATELDSQYGSDHFWTVDVKNPRGESYVQLFHGRLA